MTEIITLPIAVSALADLAARIRAEHAAATAALKRGIQHAIAAGALLLQAKAQLKHGRWGAWLKLTGVPARTASRYMMFAEKRAVLEDEIGHVADLTVREALNVLSVVPGNLRRRQADPADLNQPFEIPPFFTVLDSRTEAWQVRKRAWLALGIQSELGREDNLVFPQARLRGLMDQRGGLIRVLEKKRA